MWKAISKESFSWRKPVLLVEKRSAKNNASEQSIQNDVRFLDNERVYKKIAVDNEVDKGLLYINIPYASVWKAKVNGGDKEIYRANGAFSAVKLEEKHSVVELYVDTKWHAIFFGVSIALVILLFGTLFLPDDYFGRMRKKYIKV